MQQKMQVINFHNKYVITNTKIGHNYHKYLFFCDKQVNIILFLHLIICAFPTWFRVHRSWIYNSLCNQFLSPLKVWVRIPIILAVTCGRSVFFSRYSSFLHQQEYSEEEQTTHEGENNNKTILLGALSVETITYLSWRRVTIIKQYC